MMPATLADVVVPPRWRVSTRIAFRLCVAYFVPYVVLTQMLGSLLMLPFDNLPSVGELRPLRTIVEWTAAHVFRVGESLVVTGSGSGDKTFDWVQAFCLLVAAALATAVWSFFDRRRDTYAGIHRWFRLFLRFALGATMITYGMVKAVPLQMGTLALARLVEPYGQFSPMGVLWAFVATSTPYQITIGAAELLAGVLLLVPRTATLGALVALVDAVHILLLNMTFDVPVKLFSFQLILMALVLLAPQARRLANVLLLARPAEPVLEPALGRTPRARRLILAAQLVFAIYIVAMNAYGARQAWYQFGGGAPQSPFYGVWNVEQMTVDGVVRAPLVTDWGRWRRVVFDSRARVGFQRMDDSFAFYSATADEAAHLLALSRGTQTMATLRATPGGADQLTLAGEMDHQQIELRLRLVDRSRFLLLSRGFHWVQEYPLNR